MVEDRTWTSVLADVVIHAALVVAALSCVLPLVNTVAVSLSDRAAAVGGLVKLWPVNFTTFNYEYIMGENQFIRSFMVSVARAWLGTIVNLFIVIITAYPLAIAEDFPGKQFYRLLLILAMLFSGGMIPTYLAIRRLGLLDTFWVLILPGAVAVWSIIIMTNFYRGLPVELFEAATIDGASHWQILFKIFVPLSKPALATLGLFAAVGHWTAWFDAMIYMTSLRFYPLQTYLRSLVLLLQQYQKSNQTMSPKEMAKLSERSMRAARVVLATLPILAVYPLLQRYFVKRLTLGSVKG